ncbi:MAG: HlyD family type I secretion periplasmic adaptor subunit [Oleiphilus sp.]
MNDAALISDSETNETNQHHVDGKQSEKGKVLAFLHKDQSVTAKELYEFLPAAIEVEQTPSSKAGRAIIWAIVILFTLAAIWAYFGKVDIVAVAQGKVIPSEHIKHIQPLEAAKIKAIHIKEGQYVKKGDALITLDGTQTQADVERFSHEIQEREANIKRFQLFEQWLESLVVVDLKGSESQTLTPLNQQHLLNQQQAELKSRLSAFKNEKRKQLAEKAMTQGEVTKKQRILPVLTERVDALETLLKKDYGSKLQFLELKQELIEEEQDLLIQQSRTEQLDASIQSIQDQVDTLISETRLNNLNQLQESQLQLAGLKQELIKASERNQQQLLTAPISGQVQELAVHTVGGVVTPAQALMVIVPQESQMEVEAMILNKDIGFVHEGQKAEVKIDTFNFTKYGLIDAEISSISDDAIQDENLGLVYTARFKLSKEELQVDERMVRLSPGMSVTAEVKTGKRRLIEYFLSPLLRYKQESLGER